MEICIVVLIYWFFFGFLWIFSAIERSLLLFCFPSGGLLAILLLVFLWPFAVEAWVGFCRRIGIERAKSRCCGLRHLLITTWTAFAWWCSFVSFCNSVSFWWDFIFFSLWILAIRVYFFELFYFILYDSIWRWNKL
jgi:hypothetical protein